MDPLSSLLDHANDLKQLPRTGWLLAGVADPESVAEHSFSVAVLALFLSERINQDWEREGLHAPLDMERVLRLALIHDLAESVLTDLPKRSAEIIGRDVKRAAEDRAMAALLVGLPGGAGCIDLWREYDAGSTPEAQLVKDADKLEMVHQALRYRRRGHTGLAEFWSGHRWTFRASAQLFDDLMGGL